jgi:hypothetical protein
VARKEQLEQQWHEKNRKTGGAAQSPRSGSVIAARNTASASAACFMLARGDGRAHADPMKKPTPTPPAAPAANRDEPMEISEEMIAKLRKLREREPDFGPSRRSPSSARPA